MVKQVAVFKQHRHIIEPCIFLRNIERLLGYVNRIPLHIRYIVQNTDNHASGPGTQIQHTHSGAHDLQRLFHQSLCILSWDEDTGIYFELQSHEFCLTHNILQRDMLCALAQRNLVLAHLLFRHILFHMKIIKTAVDLTHHFEQKPCIGLCLRNICHGQNFLPQIYCLTIRHFQPPSCLFPDLFHVRLPVKHRLNRSNSDLDHRIIRLSCRNPLQQKPRLAEQIDKHMIRASGKPDKLVRYSRNHRN